MFVLQPGAAGEDGNWGKKVEILRKWTRRLFTCIRKLEEKISLKCRGCCVGEEKGKGESLGLENNKRNQSVGRAREE